jgi:phenylpyruvate tautomerase PptA (4-oxalocrotonate tautomerase family)
MPHLIVKLYAGRSEKDKLRLADEITKAVISALNSSEEAVSVGIEDVQPEHLGGDRLQAGHFSAGPRPSTRSPDTVPSSDAC